MAPSSSRPKSTGESSKIKRPSTTKATMKKSYLSEEMIVDSDDEDESPENRSIKTPTAPIASKPSQKKSNVAPITTNGTKRKSERMSSSNGSEDDSDASEGDDGEDTAGRQAKKAKVAKDMDSSSGELESSEEEEEEDTDDEDEDMPDVDVRSHTGKPPGTIQASPDSIPFRRLKPPTGFTALNLQAMKSSLLASSDLAGKQIWHICAPANVPLDSITDIAVDAFKSNLTALSYQGVQYAWSESPDGEMCTVLLPSRDGYVAAQQKIMKKLHLRQKIDIPHLSSKQHSQVTGSSAAAQIAQASVTTIRPQPKGLRMRYKPPGFGQGDPGVIGLDLDDEGQNVNNSALQFPATLGGASEKHDTLGSEGAKKKSRKNKDGAATSNGARLNGSAGVRYEEGSSAPVTKAPVMKVVAPETKDPGMGDDTDLEHRRQRKMAKRLKKEAKKAKRAAS